MSSPFTRADRRGRRTLSRETNESLDGSEGPSSSVIRLPTAVAKPATSPSRPLPPPPLPPKPEFLGSHGSTAQRGQHDAPPPLPPKPIYARAAVIQQNTPPPLPPKPESARGEKLVEGTHHARNPELQATRVHAVVHEHREPVKGSRPLPTSTKHVMNVSSDKKPSSGEDNSWRLSLTDDKSQLELPLPPEHSVTSDGEPMRSSFEKDGLELSHQFLSEHFASLKLPLAPPPFSAHQHCVSSQFFQLYPSPRAENVKPLGNVELSAESAEDSHIGAIVLGRRRLKPETPASLAQPAPIPWRLYKSQEPADKARSVLQEYLTNVSLKSRGRNRALQLLTGYVVGACLKGSDVGGALLSEIVLKMRGAERSERDGSIFTLLMNIGAHLSFVQRVSWSSIEEVVFQVFSEVVEEMDGRQDDDVMWERALRCYLVLLKSSDQYQSDDVSSRCLAALALHLGDMTHSDVDHVLIAEGLCLRLQTHYQANLNCATVDVTCLEEIGGIDTILTLFARTPSPSARRRMFAVIYDITVLQCLEDMSHEEISELKDQIALFRALLQAHDIAHLLIHTFRVGPCPDFVLDTIRMLLFSPLSTGAFDCMHEAGFDPKIDVGSKAFQEKNDTISESAKQESEKLNVQFRTALSNHVLSTRTLVKILDKKFCLRVLRQMERMAAQHSRVLAQRELVHFAREWKILSEIEDQLQRFLFSRSVNQQKALEEVLTKLYVAVVDVTSGRSNLKSVLYMTEMIIEFFTMPTVVMGGHMRQVLPIQSIPQKFLRGGLLVSRDLLYKADLSIFTLLLLGSQRKVPPRRLSEGRQCLVEFLGGRKDGVELLKQFVNDDDPIVAYRASEIVGKFTEG